MWNNALGFSAVVYTTGFFTKEKCRAIVAVENRATPGKEKDMIAVRFSLPEKKHTELQSSFQYLDRLFVRSYKAKKNRNVIS